MQFKEKRPYRKGVGIMLFNHEDKIFTAKRLDTTTCTWQMPQGGIDQGEQPLDAAFREMKEEIGTDNAVVLAELDEWLTYDFPAIVNAKYLHQYQGQQQKWFAFRFLGKDKDINLNTIAPEFTHWKWVEVDELLHDVIYFKKDIYGTLIKKLVPKIKTSISHI